MSTTELSTAELFPYGLLWTLLAGFVVLGLGAVVCLLGERGWRTPAGLVLSSFAVAVFTIALGGFLWNGAVGYARFQTYAQTAR